MGKDKPTHEFEVVFHDNCTVRVVGHRVVLKTADNGPLTHYAVEYKGEEIAAFPYGNVKFWERK